VRRAAWIIAIALMTSSAWSSERGCITPELAVKHVNKDVCLMAHVYDVIELADGTRFLDLCSPLTTDAECRFTVVSLKSDRNDVGDLEQYRGLDIQLRGTIRPFNARTEMVLSRERQFHGGSEKFHPNPALLKGYSAEDHNTAFADRAASSSRHSSSFSQRH